MKNFLCSALISILYQVPLALASEETDLEILRPQLKAQLRVCMSKFTLHLSVLVTSLMKWECN